MTGALVEPQVPRAPVALVRELWVSPSVARRIESDIYSTALLVVGRFRQGHVVRMALTQPTDPKAQVDLKRLDNVDEVWTMRFTNKPFDSGWRVLGRFIRPNIFVGLCAADRRMLIGTGYKRAIKGFLFEWDLMLTGTPIVRGQVCGDYLTGNFIHVQ